MPTNTETDLSPAQARSSRIEQAVETSRLSSIPNPTAATTTASRVRHLVDSSSPVNENGSFEHDRVIKSGLVLKRTRRTKSWKNIYMFLRPQSLSIYRDPEGTELRHKIPLSDITAVARQKDPKGRMSHVFGIFTPSRNYCLAAQNEKEASGWVEVIGREARIDRDEYDMGVAAPPNVDNYENPILQPEQNRTEDQVAIYSSSEPENHTVPLRRTSPEATSSQALTSKIRTASRISSHGPADITSGNEALSYSDNSDTIGAAAGVSAISLALPTEDTTATSPSRPPNGRSHTDVTVATHKVAIEQERVACHGWVKYLRKSTSRLRQWKNVWMVLRPKSLALYKSGDEYAAIHVLPFSSIIDAIDIDPISSSKRCCMQIITEDQDYKFCLEDEDDLAHWLGSLKSLLMKRKETLKTRTTT